MTRDEVGAVSEVECALLRCTCVSEVRYTLYASFHADWR